MRRVNREHITEVVDGYLQRRNFTSMPSQSTSAPLKMIANAINMASAMDTSSLGAISCASVTDGSSSEGELQFGRLVQFVKEAHETHKPSLMNILFPVFISIYVDMLVGGLKQTAHKFHQTNRPIFNNLPVYRSTIETIMIVVQKYDKEGGLSLSKMLHAELGENKYSVSFSPETLTYLTNYLASRDNTLVLQVFNSNVTVETNDQAIEAAPPSRPDAASVESEAAISALRSAISETLKVVPPQPEMKIHTFTSKYPRVICGHVTKKHIILGCDDSSLQLMNKNGEPIRRRAPTKQESAPDVSKVRLIGDWLEDVEECATSSSVYEPKPYITMRGHSSEVFSIASFDESDYVISCSADKSIRLWDTNTCVNKVIYHGHTQTIWSLDTGKGSTYFASCSKDRTAKLWTTERTFPLRSYAGHTMSVDCVKFHHSNHYMATASQDRTIRLWNVQEGKCVRLMQGHKGLIMCLSFSPVGGMLASAGEDRRVRLWDLNSGELIKELKGHTDTIRCLDFNADGTLLCSGAQDNTIITWDTRLSPETQGAAKTPSSPGAAGGAADIVAIYNAPNTNIISIQSQDYGLMNVIGVT